MKIKVPGVKASDWVDQHWNRLLPLMEQVPNQYDWELVKRIEVLIETENVKGLVELFDKVDAMHRQIFLPMSTVKPTVLLALHKKIGNNVVSLAPYTSPWDEVLAKYISENKGFVRLNEHFAIEETIKRYRALKMK